MTRSASPLDGIKVLALTTFLSGPFAAQLLGDLGAEIIKIETLEGDSSRDMPGPAVDGESAYYLASNRNKMSLAVNLKNPRGLKIVRDLIAQSDVVLENFRPGVAARLGLQPAAITKEHPRVVWASISGFGQDGPWRDRPAYDIIVQALSGVMSLTGHAGGPAARLGIPAGDVIAGLYAVIGILSALVERNVTGRGQIIDVSMLDCQLAMLSYQAVYASVSGIPPNPQGAGHDSIATYRSFAGADGLEFVVAANTHHMWLGMCDAVGLEHLPGDPRFHSASDRLAHKDELWAALESRFLEAPAQGWVDKLVSHGVPAAPILNVIEALSEAKSSGREIVVELERDGASFETVGNPIRLAGSREFQHLYPPRLGEHTAHLLRTRLSFSDEMIHEYVSDGAVRTGRKDGSAGDDVE